MRILLSADPEIPVPPSHYGGIQRIVADLATALQQQHHTVGFIGHPESNLPFAECWRFPGHTSTSLIDSLRNAAAMRNAFSDFQPDVIHHFARLLYLVPILGSNVPKIMSYQRIPSSRAVRTASLLAPQSMHFTGCSAYIAALGQRAGGQWNAIPNFVDPDGFSYTPEVPDDAPLVFLSRLERVKGAHAAVRLARLTERPLILAGNLGTLAHERAYFKQEVEPWIDGKLITYVGPVNNEQKSALLASAAALILPLEWDEPFGIVFIEALACGTPVIAPPRGAVPEIVRHGIEGFHAYSQNEMVEAIQKVSTIDRAACRQRVLTRFSTDQVVRQYETLYRHCLEKEQQCVEC